MTTRKVTLTNPTGLHARPATGLVNLVKNYKCKCFIQNGTKKVVAGSIINVLTLGAKQGTVLEIICDGEDENNAVEAIANYIENIKD